MYKCKLTVHAEIDTNGRDQNRLYRYQVFFSYFKLGTLQSHRPTGTSFRKHSTALMTML